MSEVNPFKTGAFVPIFDWLLTEPGVTITDAYLYGLLARYRGGRPTGECRPSMASLADAMGTDARDVRRRIRKLENAGLIASQRRPARPSLYFFSRGPLEGSSETESAAPGPPNPQTVANGSSVPGVPSPAKRGCAPPSNKIEEQDQQRSQVASSRHTAEQRGEDDSVFQHWVSVMGKDPARTKLNGKRLEKLRARRREGYTDEQLCRAIDGCKLSAFHMGENERREVYNDLASILRDGTSVEAHADRAERASPKQSSGPEADDLRQRLVAAQERGDATAQRALQDELNGLRSPAPTLNLIRGGAQ